MTTSTSARPTLPPALWLSRGRYDGSDAAAVVRQTLERLKGEGVIDDHREPPEAATLAEYVFEARWKVAGTVIVRARLSLARDGADGQEWVLAAEAERAWNQDWPSPATMFWPDDPAVAWDHEPLTGVRLRRPNRLPEEDKDIRALLRNSVRGGWAIGVVVHEAMTPDAQGRLPLHRHLPPGLRHRVVEYRAAPEQLRVVNRALRDFHIEVPRGGAVVLPVDVSREDAADLAVRTVFLDGSCPDALVTAVCHYAGLSRPLPEGAGETLTALRDDWHLTTTEEELVRQRALVAMYAEALDAMTQSRDLYREAAERAHEALEVYRDSVGELVPQAPAAQPPAVSPLQQLTRRLGWFKDGGSGKGPRPASAADRGREDEDPSGD
ncbi:hypothetical protein ACIQOU_12105 [Streptomyces sp. NPDC091279]|uniref:hypothetical protein n=1 Tax=unclassified Streptomyces TaxID=2593676 RepID=UPI0037FC179E